MHETERERVNKSRRGFFRLCAAYVGLDAFKMKETEGHTNFSNKAACESATSHTVPWSPVSGGGYQNHKWQIYVWDTSLGKSIKSPHCAHKYFETQPPHH